MNMNYSDIKEQLKDSWEQLADNPYATDLVNEFAESALPVYYSEIIKDWQEMPHEYDDQWAAEGYEAKSIYSLMTYDLALYYSNQYYRAYNELCEEMEMA